MSTDEIIIQNLVNEYIRLLKENSGGLYRDLATRLFQQALITTAEDAHATYGPESWTPEIVNEANRRCCQITIFDFFLGAR